MEQVKTLNGLTLNMQLIKEYTNGKLFFCQERLCITNLNNEEIRSYDVISYIEEIV